MMALPSYENVKPGPNHMQDFSFDTHIFKEGDTYVAYVPALDVSSCGATDEEARRNIRDAVRGFLTASEQMGTLDEILREAGYQNEAGRWRAPEFVSMDRLTMSIK
jgi:predicted RNase H-like HicB family nuclease